MAITSLKSGLPVPEDGSEIVILQAFDPWPSKIKSKSPLPVCRDSITLTGPIFDADNVSI